MKRQKGLQLYISNDSYRTLWRRRSSVGTAPG